MAVARTVACETHMRRSNLDAKRVEDLPCAVCGRLRSHPTHDSRDWQPTGPGSHRFELTPADCARLSRVEVGHRMRLETKNHRGLLDPPLPPPAERRRIREAAGWTQEDLGDELGVSRHLVYRWEKPNGYIDEHRLPGREPLGETRRRYATLLESLARQPPTAPGE
jgi:DNA-binding XRE family transcriptional regulator